MALPRFDEILERRKKGSLKIYLGYAAGVGKTYSMLQEAHRLKKRGFDVVIGYLANPDDRTSTIQTGGSINNYNAVQVTVRRSASVNGLVHSFFGTIFGQIGEAASASASAAQNTRSLSAGTGR